MTETPVPVETIAHSQDQQRAASPTPRWVKVFGALGGALVLLIVLMLAVGGGEGHGPGRHTGGGSQSSTDVTEAGTEGHSPQDHGP